MKHITIRGSVIIFTMIAAIGSLAQGALSWRQTQEAEVVSNHLLTSVQVARAAGAVDMMHDGLRANALTARIAGPDSPEPEKAAIRQELREFSETLAQSLERVAAVTTNDRVRSAAVQVKPVVDRYVSGIRALVDAELKDAVAAQALRPSFEADFKALEEALERLSGLVEEDAAHVFQERQEMLARAQWMTPVLSVLTIGLILGYGLPFSARLLRGLGAEPDELRDFATRIADGELHAKFTNERMAPRSVAASMLSMRDRLSEAVRTIRDSAVSVASGSQQIRAGNRDVAVRTLEQASQLEHTAATMEQMSRSVQHTAEHARSASQLAARASAAAGQGGDAVDRVVSTMSEIQVSSRRISEIVGVIDSIAFQTNILALNSAVEAARAGEQGRGFAVVAGEVRSLAQRSAAAAKEIKLLIDSSVSTVDSGNRIVAEAGTTMRDLVDRVRQVHDLIDEIGSATDTQAQGIGSVNAAVVGLDQSTRSNAAMVEQSASAAISLEEQAQRLAASVTVFRLAPSV